MAINRILYRGTPDDETISGTDRSELFWGNAGDDSLTGGDGHDEMLGEAGNDVLLGEDGADTLDGGTGNDTLLGGDGGDRIRWTGLGRVDGGAGADTLELAAGAILSGTADIRGIEMLVHHGGIAGTAGADLFNLFALSVQVWPLPVSGGDGADTIIGGAFALRAEGGSGDDLLTARRRDDTLAGEDGNDTLRGGRGNDSLQGGSGDDVLLVEGAADTLDGGDGDDLLRVGDRDDDVSIFGTEIRVFGGAGEDTIVALSGPGSGHRLAGAAGEDDIAVSDIIIREFFDLLAGGEGNDRYIIDSALPRIFEERDEGTDVVVSFVAYTLGASLENLRLVGTGAINGTGNGAANRIAGNESANRLLGLGAADVLMGGGGADTLEGGEGGDVLAGGAGADRFVLEAPSEGPDRIMDFVSGEYAILLAAADFGGLQPASFVARASNAATAPAGTAQLIYHTGLGVLAFDPDGIGAAAAVRIAVLTGAPTLAASDILVA